MNTEYVAVFEEGTVADALAAVRSGEEDLLEGLNTVFLVDEEGG